MARATLSHDILGACLVLAQGDVRLSAAEIIARGAVCQQRHGCHFGISDADLAGMLARLVAEMHGFGSVLGGDGLQTTRLRDIAPLMLSYLSVYCNDEGEHWTKAEDQSGDTRVWMAEEFDWAEHEVAQAMALRQAMLTFVATWGGNPPDVEHVQRFMAERGVTEDVLVRCTVPG